MPVSLKGHAFLLGEEGIVLKPYLDNVGVWTVAGGHTAAAGPPDPRQLPKDVEMPLAEALELFVKTLAKYNDEVRTAIKRPMLQHQEDALTSFHYNTGGIFKARLTQLFNAGDVAGAGDAFMGWIRPRSIVPRRTREMRLFDEGIYGDRRIPIWNTNNAGRLRGISRSYSQAEIINMLPGAPQKPVEGGWPVLGLWDRGPEVEALQTLLSRQGYDLMADGVFGPATQAALIKFQRGLVLYGKTGPLTWIALGRENPDALA